MLPLVSGEFRAAFDPELRFAPSGVAVGTIRAVAQKQKKNDAGEWVDDKMCWVTLTAFNTLAENIVETVQKGDLLSVIGRLQTDQWEDKEGNKRTTVNIVVDHIGPSLKFNTAQVNRTQRSGAKSGDSGGQQKQDHGDPWAVPAAAGQTEEPPF